MFCFGVCVVAVGGLCCGCYCGLCVLPAAFCCFVCDCLLLLLCDGVCGCGDDCVCGFLLGLWCLVLHYSRPSVRLACSTFGLSFSSSCRRVWSSWCSVGVWCVSIFVMLVMFAWVRWCVMCVIAWVVVVAWVVIPISVCWFGDS